jgi:hypothetical protein
MADAFLLEPLRVGAQRWHAGAGGSTPQMGEASLSCIRYRVTAKSTRRIAITVQILMRDIKRMKLRWDLVGVEKSPACVGGGALSCGAYSRKALRPPQQIKCGNAGVGSQCVDKKRPHRSGAKVCLFAEDGLPQRDNSERGDWFQKEKPRRSGARTNPGRKSR